MQNKLAEIKENVYNFICSIKSDTHIKRRNKYPNSTANFIFSFRSTMHEQSFIYFLNVYKDSSVVREEKGREKKILKIIHASSEILEANKK